MMISRLLISSSWLVLIAYWALLAGRVKPGAGGKWQWPREIGVRLAILILVVLALRHLGANHIRPYVVNSNRIAGFVGSALCLCGVSVAVWARVRLGRNWGMPMAEKMHPQLVTRGPYAYIRHPIYAGILLAIFGSSVGQSILWAIPLFIAGPYFVYSARREERRMTEEFPLQYSEYKKRTRMLIPFIF